jgi:chorismate dehydratase
MSTPRISASSYSNTAPLVWSFLYGQNHGKSEIILDIAPARSAELLAQDRVDAALVPVIAYQMIEGVRLIPDVCVGARERVRSVCLVTNGMDLDDVRSVALDVSSRTSVVLTKIIVREFLGYEPQWRPAEPNIDAMLAGSDAALLIGDPALRLSGYNESAIRDPRSAMRIYDLANLWHQYTGLGFVFAMWMTKQETCAIDFAVARDEGLAHLTQIIANYASDTHLDDDAMRKYLSENISYSVNEPMRKGMELYFQLAAKNGLITHNRELSYIG